MTTHVSTERMHEALDGVLTSAELQAVERHLTECDACRNEHARLSEVVGALRTLPRTAETPDGVWAGILDRIEATDRDGDHGGAVVLTLPTARPAEPAVPLRSRKVRMSIPQLAAAAAAVALLSAGSMRLAMRGPGEAGAESAAATVAGEPGGAAARAVSLEATRYQETIDQLEQILAEGRSVLAPETLVTIDESLRTVDEAMADIEAALARDPGSDLLLRLLATHQKTKLGVLQRAVGALQTRA